MNLLVFQWILLIVKVSECVTDTCNGNDITPSTRVGKMCQSKTGIENDSNSNDNFDSVFISLIEQENNCSCTVSVNTMNSSINLYIKRLNNITEQPLCGMEIDIYMQGTCGNDLANKLPTRCNSTEQTRNLSLFRNENLVFISKVVGGSFSVGYCIQIGIVNKQADDNSYLEVSCDNQEITTPKDTITRPHTALNDVTTSLKITTPIDTPTHPQTTLNDVTTPSQITSIVSITTSISDKSQILDKTDSEGDITLYIAVGAGGGFVLFVSVLAIILLCKRRKSHHSGKEESSANCRANSTAEDDEDDGLKYNVLYASSERHDDIDVKYSTADEDTPRHISGDDEGGYSTVDDNKHIQDSSLGSTHQVTNTALEVKEEDGVEHINAPTESGCVYAVVDKRHKTNSSVKNTEQSFTSATYAAVNKNRVRHPDEVNE